YWGDGTACSENLDKICYEGKCVSDFSVGEKKISNACEFLVHFDKTYQKSEPKDSNQHTDYGCYPLDECYSAVTIEDGLCPGAENIKCCAKAKK
ncbi:MAG: hypothetical protein CO042_02135, partial [Parcubacteria group bacterium CG_4_9_14_0_2_um_filter_41_8]